MDVEDENYLASFEYDIAGRHWSMIVALGEITDKAAMLSYTISVDGEIKVRVDNHASVMDGEVIPQFERNSPEIAGAVFMCLNHQVATVTMKRLVERLGLSLDEEESVLAKLHIPTLTPEENDWLIQQSDVVGELYVKIVADVTAEREALAPAPPKAKWHRDVARLGQLLDHAVTQFAFSLGAAVACLIILAGDSPEAGAWVFGGATLVNLTVLLALRLRRQALVRRIEADLDAALGLMGGEGHRG